MANSALLSPMMRFAAASTRANSLWVECLVRAIDVDALAIWLGGTASDNNTILPNVGGTHD